MLRALALSSCLAFAFLTGCSAPAEDPAQAEITGESSAASTSVFKVRCDACRNSCNRDCNGPSPIANASCDRARVVCSNNCFATLDCRIAYPNVRHGADGNEGASE